jgi:hypothetical protein
MWHKYDHENTPTSVCGITSSGFHGTLHEKPSRTLFRRVCSTCEKRRQMSEPIPVESQSKREDEQFEEILTTLNHLFKQDPVAVEELFAKYSEVNDQEIIDNPYVVFQRDWESRKFFLTPLGLINGIMNAAGLNRIAAVWDTDTGNLLGFTKYNQRSV